VFRVFVCITTEHDCRLVLLAGLLSIAASLGCFGAYSRAGETQGRRRAGWLLLASGSLGAGIWATLFVALLAYEPAHAAGYDPLLALATPVLAAAPIAAGLTVSALGWRWTAAGGAAIAGGIALAHLASVSALQMPATADWGGGYLAASLAAGTGLAAAGLLAWHRMERRRALWVAPALLSMAILSLHFTAMGGLTLAPGPLPEGGLHSLTRTGMAVAVAGVAELALVAVLTAVLVGGRSLQRSLAIDRELRRQNAALRQREDELRVQNRRFEVTLANMRLGLCMIDPERRLVVCNRRYVEMYDLPAELVQPGARIEDIFEYRIRKGLYSGADDEEYRTRGFSAVLEPTTKTRLLSDGRIIQIWRQPTGDGGWIAIHEDITERQALQAQLAQRNELLQEREAELKARNRELETQKSNLDTALANMSQGLAMFDAEERLVLANARYAEIYGLAPGQLRPGTTLRELVQQRVANGLYPGVSVDEVVDNMRRRISLKEASHLVSRPGDGRVLSVSIHPRPEGGWVVTLQDITEREQLHARLKVQHALLQQREQELAEQIARFDTAIGNMSQGMCLYDGEQRIVFANNRYAEIYGLSPEQVRPGTHLSEVFRARAEAADLGAQGAAEYVAAGIERVRTGTSQVLKLGEGRFISVVRRQMPDGGVLTTHEDVSEREQLTAQLARQNELLKLREQQLEARNEQLDAALENMLQGLAMYDAEQRLVICNSRYAAMYGLSPEQVKPGTSVREIFDLRLAAGHYRVADMERFVRSWEEDFGEMSSRIQQLADGRIICVSRRRLAGGGRVVTHEDITERHRLSAQLEQQHALLKEREEELRVRNLQLDTALNHMLQGLAMYDAEQRLVVCNRRYMEMYGLSPEQVRPGTPLRSIIEHRIARGEFPGRTCDELLSSMATRLAGKAATHYTSQLSDGRQIAVSVQAMPDGGTVTTHHDITEQRRSEAKIAHMALHDALTGLPNRTLMNERLEEALRRVKRDEMVAIHLIDLDHFKTVNDTLGHPSGDQLLTLVADRLRAAVADTDTVARMGGDEFAIVQTTIRHRSDAAALANCVIDAIGAAFEIDGQQVMIGTSVGIALGPFDGASPDQLVRNADLALYRAKGDGRGTYRIFEPDMDAQMRERRALEYDLRKALPDRQFELHYQPIVNLASDEITGFEALIRWHHPERGPVPPCTFIPIAEEIGFIVPLGEWALREACATAAQWPGQLRVAVNLSPAQFRSPGLMQVVVAALASSGLAAERLELEITENTLLQDSEATLSMLYRLRALGVRIAMDDFGTGYSSLSYLQSFPFDKIKIDRSFIHDIADGVGSLNIVRAVAAMATGLGMATTAEGVETQEQLDKVRAEGCTEMQGYIFSRPMPAHEIPQFLRVHLRLPAALAAAGA